MLMIRECLGTCWSSEDVGGLQEVLGDDAHGAVQFADPPAVDVVLLNTRREQIMKSPRASGNSKQKQIPSTNIDDFYTIAGAVCMI